MNHIRLDNDEWDDIGKTYKLISYNRRNPDSTAVELELEYAGQVTKRVAPVHVIEWVEKDES